MDALPCKEKGKQKAFEEQPSYFFYGLFEEHHLIRFPFTWVSCISNVDPSFVRLMLYCSYGFA